MIPVVMGATTKNYEEILPPNSFIHVQNFTGPRELVSYLKFLDNDDEAYR